MLNTRKIGNQGEDVAVDYLTENGYAVIERNWQFGHLELDIIAKHDDMIIFVEVKSRSGTYFEHPSQSVNKKKQRFIIKAANAYIEKFEIDSEARFDIISIVTENNKINIDHIKDAFYPLA